MNNILNSSVCVVDNDPFTSLVYRKHLRSLGFKKISHFLSGVDFINNLHLNPEIILLVQQMEQSTSFEILKEIKRHNPNATVIMVSGEKDRATALDSLKYGAFDYIIKDNIEKERITDALSRFSKLILAQSSTSRSLFRKLIPIR